MTTSIAVSGKGGTGKTTLAALMVRHLKLRDKGAVLALDADPDSNLATVLGIPIEATLGDLREESLTTVRNLPPGMSKSAYLEAGLHQTVVETEKVDLLCMGRGEGPGCYCYVNNLLRKFADDLLPSYEWMIMDSEAGLEHLSRRTATRLDHLIAVVNRNPLTVECAQRVCDIVRSVKNDVGNLQYVVNAVPAEHVDTVRERMEPLGMSFLGHVPPDPAVEDAVFAGRSLYELADTPAVASVTAIMEKLGA